MRRLSESELSLRTVATVAEPASARSEIVLAGQATAHHTVGVVLEAAVLWNQHYLLFMTDGIPYEDFLTIELRDHHLALQDAVTIGAMYSTGSFSSLQIVEPDTVRFRFIGDTDWSIELLGAPVLALPLTGDPKGVRRRFGVRRYFHVHGNPQPASTP